MKFTIPITPIPKGRPRFGNGRTYTPKKTLEFERVIRTEVWAMMTKQERKDCPLSVPVSVDVMFHMPIPKSLSRIKQEALLGEPHMKRPDLDNLVKVIDSLNELLWKDDALIWKISAQKQWSDKGQIILEVSTG